MSILAKDLQQFDDFSSSSDDSESDSDYDAQDSDTSFQSISPITSDEEIFSDMEHGSNSDISSEDEEDKSSPSPMPGLLHIVYYTAVLTVHVCNVVSRGEYTDAHQHSKSAIFEISR